MTSQPITFGYRPFSTAVALIAFLASSVLLIAVTFSVRAVGSKLSSVLLFAIGCWGVFYVARRLRNPFRIELQHDEIVAAFWMGECRRWPLAVLQLAPPGVASLWEGSAVVVRADDGRVAFRVFRDLGDYTTFCELIKRGIA